MDAGFTCAIRKWQHDKHKGAFEELQKGDADSQETQQGGVRDLQQDISPWYSPDMILRGLNEVLMASVNAKRSIPEANPDIKDAMELIMEDMLKAQNKIVLSLM